MALSSQLDELTLRNSMHAGTEVHSLTSKHVFGRLCHVSGVLLISRFRRLLHTEGKEKSIGPDQEERSS